MVVWIISHSYVRNYEVYAGDDNYGPFKLKRDADAANVIIKKDAERGNYYEVKKIKKFKQFDKYNSLV